MVRKRIKSMSYAKRIWLLLCCLIVVIALCIGVHYYFSPEDNLSLSCQAELYGTADDDPSTVIVEIDSSGKSVVLNYRFLEQGIEQNSVIFKGKIAEIELATMTFKLQLNRGQVISNLSEVNYSAHMQPIIDASRLAISANTPLSLNVHLIGMSDSDDYAIIQFEPGSGIWGCAFQSP